MMERRKTQRKNLKLNCFFCEKKKEPSYKEYEILAKFLTDRARIISASQSGVCSKHQRKLGTEIKKARFLSLLPFVEKI